MADKNWSARFRSHDEIRSHAAIGNLNHGIEITKQGVRTRLIAWSGNGFQTESVHVLTLEVSNAAVRDARHENKIGGAPVVQCALSSGHFAEGGQDRKLFR